MSLNIASTVSVDSVVSIIIIKFLRFRLGVSWRSTWRGIFSFEGRQRDPLAIMVSLLIGNEWFKVRVLNQMSLPGGS